MSNSAAIVCEFCATQNPASQETCQACGAPLPRPAVRKQPVVHSITPPITQTNRELEQARKAGEDVEELSRKALYAYSLIWRTLAESAAIAITAFGIGLVGGATGTAWVGILGAVLVGLGVGYAIKNSYLAMFSAPIGLVIGAVVAAIIYLLLGAGMWVFVVTTSLFASLAAVLGGNRIRYQHRNLYEKLRPLIGAAGGLAFGILGMLAGAGLHAAVNALF
jgi:hypothetical protein